MELCHSRWFYYGEKATVERLFSFGTMSFQMVLLPERRRRREERRFGTMSFQMVLLLERSFDMAKASFGTMSFQMVLLLRTCSTPWSGCFGTMSFQMVLLHLSTLRQTVLVLELCHSRWFYYPGGRSHHGGNVLELCHSRWFYYTLYPHKVIQNVLELCHSRWFYYLSRCTNSGTLFWNYVIPDGSTTGFRPVPSR